MRNLAWVVLLVFMSCKGEESETPTDTDADTDADTDSDTDTDLNCVSCHGAGDDPAPPPDTLGHTATTDRGVGAHQTHLTGGTLSSPIACNECHVVPTAVDDGHNDGVPAELTFGTLASSDGATPAYDATAGTCTAYCHGATIAGGDHTHPSWTTVDGSQATCGSCHSTPPTTASHAGVTDNCVDCHSQTAGTGLTIAHPDKHVNGTIDF